MQCVVMDAMGVLFAAADDVAELLIPFVAEAGSDATRQEIETLYREASLGNISADEFWIGVGLDASVEAGYLARHRLMPGALEFVRQARQAGMAVWCLSNDIERWSEQLRMRLGIEPFLDGAVISSAVRARKPQRKIYQCLLERALFDPADMVLIDDRIKNVEAAADMGIRAMQFSGGGFAEISQRVLGWR
ncbi:MAG: HAD-IA family hydrolase [Steroidobacteraceae bacterium]